MTKRSEYMKEYMRAYRKRFTLDQRISEASRSAYRRHLKKHPEDKGILKPAKIEPIVIARCMAQNCMNGGNNIVLIHGMKAHVCDEHKHVNIFQ